MHGRGEDEKMNDAGEAHDPVPQTLNPEFSPRSARREENGVRLQHSALSFNMAQNIYPMLTGCCPKRITKQ
jgi:hypothetical protein